MFIIDELAMYNCPKGMNKVVLYCIVLCAAQAPHEFFYNSANPPVARTVRIYSV